MRTVVELISMLAAVASAVAAYMSWSTASDLNDITRNQMTGTFLQVLADQAGRVSDANDQQTGERCSELLDSILTSDSEMSKLAKPTPEFRASFPRNLKGDAKNHADLMMACLNKLPVEPSKIQIEEMRSISNEYIAKSFNIYDTAMSVTYATMQALRPKIAKEDICASFPQDPHITRIAQELSKSDPNAGKGILQLGCWR